MQTPAWHVSPVVQTLPVQAVPLGFGTLERTPVDGLHVLGWWQAGRPPGQVTRLPAVQTPDTHTTFWSQRLPSLQDVPSVRVAGLEQPVAELQTPALWHWSSGVQVTAVPPVQAPAWQVWPVRQALPALHVATVGLHGRRPRTPVRRVAGVRLLARGGAVHVTGFEPEHTPLWQVSVLVHALPSLQARAGERRASAVRGGARRHRAGVADAAVARGVAADPVRAEAAGAVGPGPARACRASRWRR